MKSLIANLFCLIALLACGSQCQGQDLLGSMLSESASQNSFENEVEVLRAASSKEARKEATDKLRLSLANRYDEHLQQQQNKRDQLQQKLDEISKQIDLRKENRQRAIDAKIQSIVDAADGIAWPEDSSGESEQTTSSGFGVMMGGMMRPKGVTGGRKRKKLSPEEGYYKLRAQYGDNHPAVVALARNLAPSNIKNSLIRSRQALDANDPDHFLKTLEPSAVRKLIKERNIKVLRSEVNANASIWESILVSANKGTVEPESDSSYVWQGLGSLDALDAKLHMYRVKSQWYIDYPKTVATFPKVEQDAASAVAKAKANAKNAQAYAKYVDHCFKKYDANSDGKLDQEELAATRKLKRAKDTDGDGMISKQEAIALISGKGR